MFLDTSRYAKLNTVQLTTRDGRAITAVVLRRLPATDGDPMPLKGNDRLDTMALRQYNDATRFWHIADANTELEARHLVQPPDPEEISPPLRVIKVPAK
jgi:hypothetical protein